MGALLRAGDGEYVLYLNGTQPWTAWCHGMVGTPTEYLTLKETVSSNFSAAAVAC